MKKMVTVYGIYSIKRADRYDNADVVTWVW